MIDMLKRHEIQVLRRAGHTLTEVAQLSGVTLETVPPGPVGSATATGNSDTRWGVAPSGAGTRYATTGCANVSISPGVGAVGAVCSISAGPARSERGCVSAGTTAKCQQDVRLHPLRDARGSRTP
jgi:hypothetical protein